MSTKVDISNLLLKQQILLRITRTRSAKASKSNNTKTI